MKSCPGVGFEPGRGDKGSTKDRPSPTPLDPNRQRIDLRLAFLACAAARFDLVEAGAITLDEAVDDLFIENFRAVAGMSAIASSRYFSASKPSIKKYFNGGCRSGDGADHHENNADRQQAH
jgi:hypothetical protein